MGSCHFPHFLCCLSQLPFSTFPFLLLLCFFAHCIEPCICSHPYNSIAPKIVMNRDPYAQLFGCHTFILSLLLWSHSLIFHTLPQLVFNIFYLWKFFSFSPTQKAYFTLFCYVSLLTEGHLIFCPGILTEIKAPRIPTLLWLRYFFQVLMKIGS